MYSNTDTRNVSIYRYVSASKQRDATLARAMCMCYQQETASHRRGDHQHDVPYCLTNNCMPTHHAEGHATGCRGSCCSGRFEWWLEGGWGGCEITPAFRPRWPFGDAN